MKHIIRATFLFITIGWSFSAQAIPLTLTQLTGITGGTPAGTAVYQADLSSVGVSNLASITISDNSAGLGGAAGQFSGFDLDAIILSTTDCASASCAAGLVGLGLFDFSPAGTLFTPGTQRLPADSKLFGTDAGGTNVDNLVATLGVFDGNSTTAIPGADGFVSMGDNGILSFNLTSLVSTGGLFMYIGEVGNNGEVAASSIEISNRPVNVPEPSALMLMGLSLVGLGLSRKKYRNG